MFNKFNIVNLHKENKKQRFTEFITHGRREKRRKTNFINKTALLNLHLCCLRWIDAF